MTPVNPRILPQLLLMCACSIPPAASRGQNPPVVDSQPEPISIGDLAPTGKVLSLQSSREGGTPQLLTFEDPTVHVLEFWATWCAPCIESLPKLGELSRQYPESQVRFTLVCTEDPATGYQFLAASKNGESYLAKLSKCQLLADHERSLQKSYVERAASSGIPLSVVVGRDRKLEWLGHPNQLADVLEQVVKGKWDRHAFAEEYDQRQEYKATFAQAARLTQQRKWDEAISLMQNFGRRTGVVDLRNQCNLFRVQVLLGTVPHEQRAQDAAMQLLTAKQTPAADQVKICSILGHLVPVVRKQLNSAMDAKLIENAVRISGRLAESEDGLLKIAALTSYSRLLHETGAPQLATRMLEKLDQEIRRQGKHIQQFPEAKQLHDLLGEMQKARKQQGPTSEKEIE